MKMLIIVCNDVIDEEFVTMLKKAGVSGYTKWREVPRPFTGVARRAYLMNHDLSGRAHRQNVRM